MKKSPNLRSQSLRSRFFLGLGAGLLTVSFLASDVRPAAAQSSDAASLCTSDVMRLCSEFVPDADRIVVCLKAKRRQLSKPCLSALTPRGGAKPKKHFAHKHRS